MGCTSWNSSCRRCICCFPYIVVISWDRTNVRCRRRSVYILSVGSETGCQGKSGRFRLSDYLCDVGSSHCPCVQCVPAGHPTFHGSKRGDDEFGRILRQAFYHQLCHRNIECVHVQYHCFTRCVEDICVGNDHRLYRQCCIRPLVYLHFQLGCGRCCMGNYSFKNRHDSYLHPFLYESRGKSISCLVRSHDKNIRRHH